MDLSRLARLFNEKDIQTLKNSSIAIFGLGGVGSYALEALARSGVGNFYLIDGDIIEKSNVNRQLLALNSTIGMKKVDVAKKRVMDINEDCNVYTLFKMLKGNAEEEVDLSFLECVDAIVDAVDYVPLKAFLALEAQKKDVIIIASGGSASRTTSRGFEIVDIYKTQGCPLCRSLRKKLREQGVKKLDVIYAKDGFVGKEGYMGSASWVPSIVGILMAEYVVKKLCQLI